MKKRLLSLLLVAFVLCTMAINCFASTLDDGRPVITKYSYASKVYGQFNWNTDSNYRKDLFYKSTCPDCQHTITVINVDIPFEVYDNYSIINGEYQHCVAVGSYYTYNRFGFKPCNFILKPVASNYGSCSGYSTDITQVYLYGFDIDWNTGRAIYRYYLHYDMDIVSSGVDGGWYFCIFDNGQSNQIAKSMYSNAVNWRNDYNSNKNLDVYQGRQLNWLITNFSSSEYSDLNVSGDWQGGYNLGYSNGESTGYNNGYAAGSNDGYNNGYSAGSNDGYNNGLNDGYNNGLNDGYGNGYNDGLANGEYGVAYENGKADGYNAGYSNGHNDGIIKGQKMTNFTFASLIDGALSSLNGFFEPFLSLGINDITIKSLVGACFSLYIVMFLIKLVKV